MYLKTTLNLILFLFLIINKNVYSQQQCMQLQSCIDLSIKTINEMQHINSPGSFNALAVHSGSVQCRSLRTNFECMMNYSPYCLRNDLTRSYSQYIVQAKQLLDSNCDQGTAWSNSQCYRRPEITQNCEKMIPDLSIGTFNYFTASIPKFICEKYQRFRHCVHNVILSQCSALERETFFSYLFDRAQEISYKCANETYFFENYDRYHPLSNSPYENSLTRVGQPPYTYGGILNNNYPSSNIYPIQSYGRYNEYYDRNRFDSSLPNRYFENTGYGLNYERGYPGNIISNEYTTYEESNCLERTRYVSRQCEESLMQRQKDARNTRNSIDMQRRICCSMFYYRDCLSTTVLKHCRDNSQAVVDILMGEGRRRELTIGCRDYTYEYCSFSSNKSINYLLLTLIAFMTMLKTFVKII